MRRKETAKDHDQAVSIALGQRLRSRREELRLSRRSLSELVDLSAQQIQFYERGLSRLAVPTLLRMAGALDLEPARLLAGLPVSPAKPNGAPAPSPAAGEPATSARRRRRGAVWDPADIRPYREGPPRRKG